MTIRLLSVLMLLTSFAAPAAADPFGEIRGRIAGGGTLPRLPDDNVEGTIWEYKGVLEKGKKDGKREARIEGYFRTEGEAIFALALGEKLPSGEDVKKVLEAIKDGELLKMLEEVKLPDGSPKRIGEFKLNRSGKLSLSFDDESEDGLFGSLILQRKKGQKTVWIGDYQEKEGKKRVRTWQMTVRSVKD